MVLRVYNLSKNDKATADAVRERKCNAIQLSLKLLGEKVHRIHGRVTQPHQIGH